jgi:hypothetical protein
MVEKQAISALLLALQEYQATIFPRLGEKSGFLEL